jgi:hypothetical protein
MALSQRTVTGLKSVIEPPRPSTLLVATPDRAMVPKTFAEPRWEEEGKGGAESYSLARGPEVQHIFAQPGSKPGEMVLRPVSIRDHDEQDDQARPIDELRHPAPTTRSGILETTHMVASSRLEQL